MASTIKFTDAHWLNAEHTACDLIVIISGVSYPYTYVEDDDSSTSKKIKKALEKGQLVPVEYVENN